MYALEKISNWNKLARLAISQTERNIRHGVDRTERITAPSGAVILF